MGNFIIITYVYKKKLATDRDSMITYTLNMLN